MDGSLPQRGSGAPPPLRRDQARGHHADGHREERQRRESYRTRGAVRRACNPHAMVFIFLAWLVVGVVMWRGYHRWAVLGAVGAMVLTLIMLKVHATDVIGLCL